MKLHDFQLELLSQIYNKGGDITDYVIDGYFENIDVYINNCHLLLAAALNDKYPICAKLIGADFAHFAQKYCLNHPLNGGDVTFYGSEFPEFIKNCDFGEITPLIYDIAQIENAKFNCELSDFETHIDFATFNNLVANGFDEQIKITNSMRIIQCETNALSAFTLANSDILDQYEFAAIKEKIIIWRSADFNLNLLVIDDFWAALLGEYSNSQNIINAINHAITITINQAEAQNQFIQTCENGLFINIIG